MTIALVVLAAVIVALLVDRARAQSIHDQQVSRLLQRIQAPARAVAVQARREDATPRPKVQPVALEDDDAMARAAGEEVDDDGGS